MNTTTTTSATTGFSLFHRPTFGDRLNDFGRSNGGALAVVMALPAVMAVGRDLIGLAACGVSAIRNRFFRPAAPAAPASTPAA